MWDIWRIIFDGLRDYTVGERYETPTTTEPEVFDIISSSNPKKLYQGKRVLVLTPERYPNLPATDVGPNGQRHHRP
jgi:hypothetical protein